MRSSEVAEVLTEHGHFVRTLAGKLAGDANADDLTQETWLRLIEKGPKSRGSLRHWLRSVVRNLAANAHRSQGRRRAREAETARPEAQGEAEQLEHAERVQSLLRAVLSLDEPYRSTILARYYSGQDTTQMAEASGTPIATVRSRERRALEQLRERLSHKRGMRGVFWIPWRRGLARMATMSFGPQLVMGVGVLIAGSAVWMGLRAAEARASTKLPYDDDVATKPPEAASVVRSSVPIPVAVVASSRSVTPHSLPSSPSPPLGLASSQASGCEVRGRFLLPDGRPSIGQLVMIRGRVCQSHRRELGVPENWEDPEVATDSSGAFVLRFDPPAAFCFDLKSKRAGFAREKWSWMELRATERMDLGDIVLRPGGSIEGTVLDQQGEGVQLAGLEVSIQGENHGTLGEDRKRQMAWEYVPVDPNTGRFRCADLPAGRVHLKGGSRRGLFGGGWVDGPTLEVVPGETVETTLVWDVPDESRHIILRPRVRTFSSERPELSSVRLVGTDFEPRHPVRRSSWEWAFEDVPDGTYRIEIDDPRFVSWHSEDVQPGEVATARLEGSCGLDFDVRTAEGDPVPRYSVSVTRHGTLSFPNRFFLHDGKAALPGGRLRGLMAGSYTVDVTIDEVGKRSAQVDDLQPGEVRAVTVSFGAPAVLSGRVLQSDGAPVFDALVLLVTPAVNDDSPRSVVLRSDGFASNSEIYRQEVDVQYTNEAGEFRFEPGSSGSYAVCASTGLWHSTASEAIAVAMGEEVDGIELRLPDRREVQGSTGLDAGVVLGGLRILARTPGQKPILYIPGELAAAIDDTGIFLLESVPDGPLELYVALSRQLGGGQQAFNQHLFGARPWAEVRVEGEDITIERQTPELIPGRVAVFISMSGADSLAGLQVRLIESVGVFEGVAAHSFTDTSGYVLLPAFAGTYQVEVENKLQGWKYRDQAQLSISPGESKSIVVEPVPD